MSADADKPTPPESAATSEPNVSAPAEAFAEPPVTQTAVESTATTDAAPSAPESPVDVKPEATPEPAPAPEVKSEPAPEPPPVAEEKPAPEPAPDVKPEAQPEAAVVEDESPNVPPDEDENTGEGNGLTEQRFAARGGWLAPTPEQVQAGVVRRVAVPAHELREAILAGTPIDHVQTTGLKIVGTTVKDPVVITKANLTRVDFQKTTFEQKVHFKNCLIEGIEFTRTKFQGDLVFEACEFRGVTHLRRFSVKGTMRMRDSTINGKFALRSVTVSGWFDAWDTTFTQWADFVDVIFENQADFRSADFDEGLVFTGCTFKRDALFRGTTVSKKFAMQRDTKIEGCLDLQKAKLHDYTYVDDVQFGPAATVSVWNCMPQALLLKWEQVAGRLDAMKQGDHVKAAQELGVLKNNYQRLNWLDDEDAAYYEFKREQRLARKGRAASSAPSAGAWSG